MFIYNRSVSIELLMMEMYFTCMNYLPLPMPGCFSYQIIHPYIDTLSLENVLK
jgi:hypothetical protein